MNSHSHIIGYAITFLLTLISFEAGVLLWKLRTTPDDVYKTIKAIGDEQRSVHERMLSKIEDVLDNANRIEARQKHEVRD